MQFFFNHVVVSISLKHNLYAIRYGLLLFFINDALTCSNFNCFFAFSWEVMGNYLVLCQCKIVISSKSAIL